MTTTQAPSEQLAAARKAKGHSQEQAAREIGVTLRAYTRWESGEGRPHDSNLRPVEEYAGIPVEAWFR